MPRDRVEQAALAFLTYVRDHPDGFAILAQDTPLLSKGGIASLLNDLAERVGGIFAAAFGTAGYDARSAPIYANALIGMVTFVGKCVVDRRAQAKRRGRGRAHRGARVDGPAPFAEAPPHQRPQDYVTVSS